MKFINSYKSPNYNYRKKSSTISFIIIHYTAINSYEKALDHLCSKENQVSCHFLINKKGNIYNIVDEKYRAWHAGHSFWNKITDINSNSIGIELDNSGHYNKFEGFSKLQINSLLKLINYLLKKYKIRSKHILGHSDISPYRKIDPGEKFPWNKIIKTKFTKIYYRKIEEFFTKKKLKTKKHQILFMLDKIGYETEPSKYNFKKYTKLIKVYQMRYCKIVSGKMDINSFETLLKHFYYNEFLTD